MHMYYQNINNRTIDEPNYYKQIFLTIIYKSQFRIGKKSFLSVTLICVYVL